MKTEDNLIQKFSSSSYIIAIPDDFTLTKVVNLEDLLSKIFLKLDIPKGTIRKDKLDQTLNKFKSESDTLLSEMSKSQWVIFILLQHYQLVIHEFPTNSENARIINILARGKQQRLEQILSGQYQIVKNNT